MSHIQTVEELQRMKWYEFERLTKDILIKQGYEKGFVTFKGVKGGDDGIDVIVEKNNERYLVQSKCWTKNHGLINPIRELGGSLKKYNLNHGMFFVSIKANAYEREQAGQYGIELWDAYDILSALDVHTAGMTQVVKRSFSEVLIEVLYIVAVGICTVLKFIAMFVLEVIFEILSNTEQPKRYKRRSRRKNYSY